MAAVGWNSGGLGRQGVESDFSLDRRKRDIAKRRGGQKKAIFMTRETVI
jgi:hypothetical protein